MSGVTPDSSIPERTGTVPIRAVGDAVLIGLPAAALGTPEDRYLRLTPAQARTFATQLLSRADEANGRRPTHRFIIDVPKEEQP